MNDKRQLEENRAWNRLSKWETWIDEKVRQIIGDGDMSGHSGAGQPLQLDRQEFIPEDERIAYKMMQDNDVVPPWLSLAFTLRDKHRKILRRLHQYARDYAQRKQDAIRAGSFMRLQHAEDRWQAAVARLNRDVGLYNRELLNYNLMVPEQIGQMVPINIKEELDFALQQAEGQYQNSSKEDR